MNSRPVPKPVTSAAGCCCIDGHQPAADVTGFGCKPSKYRQWVIACASSLCYAASRGERQPAGAVASRAQLAAQRSTEGVRMQTLGKYQLGAPLGQGGMGAVYRSFHPQLNRPVAVKVMLANVAADPQAHQRFLREAQVVATLSHPN